MYLIVGAHKEISAKNWTTCSPTLGLRTACVLLAFVAIDKCSGPRTFYLCFCCINSTTWNKIWDKKYVPVTQVKSINQSLWSLLSCLFIFTNSNLCNPTLKLGNYLYLSIIMAVAPGRSANGHVVALLV